MTPQEPRYELVSESEEQLDLAVEILRALLRQSVVPSQQQPPAQLGDREHDINTNTDPLRS